MSLPIIRKQIEARVQDTGDTMTGSLKVTGRYQGSGDDEGILIGQASNGYAGLILGDPSNRRSVFYLNNDTTKNPWWRYNNGTSSFDISHPGKNGTIALTSDLIALDNNYLKLSGGTLTGSLYGTNIIPSTAGTGAIGQSGVPWLNVHAQYFRVYDPNNVQTGFLDAPTAGTTSVQGETYLVLGNSTASGSNGNSRGRLRLYGTSSGYIDLYATASTSNYSISLPAKSGVAVVTSSNAYGTTQVGSIIAMTTSTNGARNIFKLYPDSDTANNYGDILTIQSAGDLYIGGGESAEALYGAIGATANENTYVSADNNVYIVPNCNTVANRKTFTFNTAGALVVPTHTDYTTYKARNTAANTSAMTASSTSLSNGNIYLQYT